MRKNFSNKLINAITLIFIIFQWNKFIQLSHLLAISLFVCISNFLQQKVKVNLPPIQFPFIVQPAHQSIYIFLFRLIGAVGLAYCAEWWNRQKIFHYLDFQESTRKHLSCTETQHSKGRKNKSKKKSKEESKSPSHFKHDPC